MWVCVLLFSIDTFAKANLRWHTQLPNPRLNLRTYCVSLLERNMNLNLFYQEANFILVRSN